MQSLRIVEVMWRDDSVNDENELFECLGVLIFTGYSVHARRFILVGDSTVFPSDFSPNENSSELQTFSQNPSATLELFKQQKSFSLQTNT